MPDPDGPIVGRDGSFQVRPVSGLDAEAMLPLIQSHAAFEQGAASVSVAAFRSVLDRKQSPVSPWVAEQAGRLVGYATATVDVSTWAGRPFLHLDCLFVQDGCRGSGIISVRHNRYA